MSRFGSQRQTFLRLLTSLRPHWRRDRHLPERIERALRLDRRFGSRDRRLYRELIYTTLRHLAWIEPLLDTDEDRAAALAAWLAQDNPATHDYREALSAGWPPCPAEATARARLLQADLRSLFPDWLARECPAALAPAEQDALLRRAPLWLRLQTDDPAAVTAEFDHCGWRWRASPVTPDAVAVLDEVDVTASAAFQAGRIEIQDLASQLVLLTAAPSVGENWFDACAGAGGKTLQLARLLGPHGHVLAHDIRPAALAELSRRAQRAGLANIAVADRAPDGEFDSVLVDAPCSGSGTWRRSPHLKWMTSAADLAAFARQQLALLAGHAQRVRPGGQLVYATCSLAETENASVVRAFLAAHPEFSLLPPAGCFGHPPGPAGLALLPARHDTDGFYTARFRRT